MKNNEKFMSYALKEAYKAYSIGEVPVGAVIVFNDKIIASSYNKIEKKKCVLAHAELMVIEKASKKLGVWRLNECTLYSTLQPCNMCAGAIIHSRIKRVVIGTRDEKIDLNNYLLNEKLEVVYDVLKEDCSFILKKFFKELRMKGNF